MGREGTTPDFREGGVREKRRRAVSGRIYQRAEAILAPGRVAPAEREPGVRVMNADEVHGRVSRSDLWYKIDS